MFAELRKTTNRLETRMNTGGASRNRTDVHGFAIRCITTLPLRQGRHLPSPLLYRKADVCVLPGEAASAQGTRRRCAARAAAQTGAQKNGRPNEKGARPWTSPFCLAPAALPLGGGQKFWSGRRVSNSRPQPWQGCALPTELLPHAARHKITGAATKKKIIALFFAPCHTHAALCRRQGFRGAVGAYRVTTSAICPAGADRRSADP